MKRIVLSLAAIFAFVATVVPTSAPTTQAQTRNHRSKTEFTESFVFPNDCTGELMDVTDTTVVTCHDQLRADGTFREKCEIVQFVNAVGETSGITHGVDELNNFALFPKRPVGAQLVMAGHDGGVGHVHQFACAVVWEDKRFGELSLAPMVPSLGLRRRGGSWDDRSDERKNRRQTKYYSL